MTTTPHIFRGLWCDCGDRHHQEAAYYVSVLSGDDMVLAAGPYREHGQALAMVDPVRALVATRYQGDPRAPWYAYGTVAMPAGTMRPGKLNAELDREATS